MIKGRLVFAVVETFREKILLFFVQAFANGMILLFHFILANHVPKARLFGSGAKNARFDFRRRSCVARAPFPNNG